MKYLYIGSQTEERFQVLLSLTRIASEDVIDALRDHLVNGATESNAAAFNGVKTSNFQRAFNALNEVATKIERVKEIDWYSSVK